MAKELLDKLPAVIERSRIEASLDAARSILDDVVRRAVEVTLQYQKDANLRFESREALAAEKDLKAIYPGSASNVVERIGRINKEVQSSVAVIEKLVSRELPNLLAKGAVTYRHAAVIKLVYDVQLYVDYTLALITYVSTAETAHSYKIPVKQLVNQYSVNYLNSQWPAYVDALTDLVRNSGKLEQKVRGAADILVEESDATTVAQTHGAEAASPFSFDFLATNFNFIKTWLSKRAEDRAKKYHLSNEQLSLYETQLKLLESIRSKSGTLDPALKARSDELTSLIDVLRDEITEMERYYD